MGGTETHAVDVRIIAATNRRLETAIAQKSFREDLYYRLNVIPISLPPLRERKEDIPELVELFTRQFVEEYQLSEIGISTEVVKQLTTYDWPGNVRELENAIKRALVMCSGQMLLPEHFDPILEKSTLISEPGDLNTQVHAMLQAHIEQYMESDAPLGELYAEIREVFEKPLFKIVLEHTNGNRSKASDILGINRNTLHTKLVEYQLVS